MEGSSFTSDEVNFLIYRYMLENGFKHTAFTFGCESNILNTGIDGTMVPRGALISIIQKGLHFTEAEFFAALAASSGDNIEAWKYESNLGSIGLLEAVLPDGDRLKVLERKVIDEMGEGAFARMPSGLKLTEPTRPSSTNSAPSSQSSSDNESMDGVEDENDENRMDMGASTSNSVNVKGPSPDSRLDADSSHVRITAPKYNRHVNTPSTSTLSNNGNSSIGVAGSVMGNGLNSMGQESNGIMSGVTVTTGGVCDLGSNPGQTLNNIPRPHMPNGSNIMVAGHSGKKAASAAAAAAAAAHKPGMNGTNAHNDHNVVVSQLIPHPNGKVLPAVQGLDVDLELDRNKVLTLRGHDSDVFICSWNPKTDCVASGSGDSTARLWYPLKQNGRGEVVSHVLSHCEPVQIKDDTNLNRDVTSLNWNESGDLLATGCYDGMARIWNSNGDLLYYLGAHKGPIFALKWNFKGDRVLSAGVDNTTIVWDPASTKGDRSSIQQFTFHTQSALDVDWITDDMFASCSVDRCIHVCQIGHDKPIKTFMDHKNEVNAVRYDRITRLLASCSDDRTLKVWSLSEDRPVYDVVAHDKEIYTIRWSPKGGLLASASFDHSVKIWDVERQKCAQVLSRHTDPVYTVAFSPDGRLIASGSFDRTVNVWDLRKGNVVMTYTGTNLCGGIFEVDWNARGDRIAASAGDGTLLVFDVRHLKDILPLGS